MVMAVTLLQTLLHCLHGFVAGRPWSACAASPSKIKSHRMDIMLEEHETSQVCGNPECEAVVKIGGAEIYKCEICEQSYHRDCMAARTSSSRLDPFVLEDCSANTPCFIRPAGPQALHDHSFVLSRFVDHDAASATSSAPATLGAANRPLYPFQFCPQEPAIVP
jgi:hypothetical protein